MARLLLLLLLLVAVDMAFTWPAAAHERQRNAITHIKGFEGPLPFYLETGYVEVDDTHGAELFYYFIQSERSPREDPLILWITGGPGCSALAGLVYEIGPLRFDVAGYTEGLFPRLVYFEDSWTKVSNIILVDAPMGTGFSYAREEQGLNVSLTGTGAQLRVFLEKWLSDHPEFASNPLYIAGDSYSGYTVPVTALEIANHNDVDRASGGGLIRLNLQGYLVGNPSTDDKYDKWGKVPFSRGMGLISDELYEAAQDSCSGDDYVTPSNARCANALEDIHQVTGVVAGINPMHVLEPLCVFALRERDPAAGGDTIFTKTSRLLLQDNLHQQHCRFNDYRLSYVWADDAEVRKTLGIHDGSIGNWSRCALLWHYRHDVRSTIRHHANLTRRGYRALVYNGDHDLEVTFVGTQAWIRTLGYPVVAPWRPWHSNGQAAGYTMEYAYNLTYATVKGAGHTAAEYRPKECLDMLRRWTSPAGKL
uniref:Uncharacterized protein n=1 Tax=Avena sativa TaxID=4498 RepID=A0ACD5VQD0_AVESA